MLTFGYRRDCLTQKILNVALAQMNTLDECLAAQLQDQERLLHTYRPDTCGTLMFSQQCAASAHTRLAGLLDH